MQGDGNFVLYNPSYVPMFYTGTSGHPGSFLAVQDDGNLVIYGPNGQGALWWIGTDVNNDDPRSPGDTVGRDLILGPLGPIGHIGIWDGSKVVQAMMGLSNAIESVSLSQFKAASRYWGAAKPNVPFAFVDPECYYVHCGGDADISVLSTRTAIAQRARQIQAIGADYTLIPDATITAYPSFGNRPSIRGKYRCDTFVLDAYRHSTTFSIHMTPEQIKWVNRVQSLSSGIFFPYTVYNKLRSFN